VGGRGVDGGEGRKEEEEDGGRGGGDAEAATRCVTNETGLWVETAGKEKEGRERDFSTNKTTQTGTPKRRPFFATNKMIG